MTPAFAGLFPTVPWVILRAMSAPVFSSARPLRLLHLEDSELDHELTLANLRRTGSPVEALRVETKAEFEAHFAGPWDVIVSDYNLPGFTGIQALEVLRESGCATPFVLVSGEIGEDTAVHAMRHGASDYLLKSQLARLHPALMNAIAAAQERRRRQAADAEVAASRQRLRELAQHLQTSVENERAAIAREIHDDVGGALSALKFDLAWLERRATEPEQIQRVASALDTLSHALESSQRIMHNLRPAILEQGLVAALQWMAQRFERRTGVQTQFRCRHDAVNLPAGVPLVAYRTAQEALTNISKHAQATRVVLDLSLAGQVLSLEISDNGRGLTDADLAKAKSFGLRGLQERAGTVEGWIDISSTEQGTTLLLSVPLDHVAQTAQLSLEDAMNLSQEFDLQHNPSAWGDL
jgi:signal transduction histidine kinase